MNEDLSRLRDPGTAREMRREGDALVSPAGERFPIVAAIPRFVGADNYAADFGDQWKRFPKSQLDSHTGLPLSRERLARCFRGHLDLLAGKRVLEAGSGAGRFTEVLLDEGAILGSFDYSNAVEANAPQQAAAQGARADRRDTLLLQPDRPRLARAPLRMGATRHPRRDDRRVQALSRCRRYQSHPGELGAEEIEVWKGGNGVEAWCRKPGA